MRVITEPAVKIFLVELVVFFPVIATSQAFVHPGSDRVWQWSVPVQKARNAASRAFLWIPPDCKKVKAVVVTQNNMEELSIVENDYFRASMQQLSFAIVWVSPTFDNLFRFNEGAGEVFNGMMNDLADSSGYTELKYAPVVGMGHSAAASWPYYFAAWNPARTLCAISVSGQWPWFRSPQFAPDIWGDRNIDFIPCLETMGEYEAANEWSKEGLKERKEHPLMPLSMLACPAEGHFAATEKKIRFIAFYIKKAAQYRLPKIYPADGPPALLAVNPTTTGWLADKWRINETPAAPAAPVGKYTGDATQAFWFFDSATAKAAERYQSVCRNMKAQLLGYVQHDTIIKQRNTHLQAEMVFSPQADGVTFVLKGSFLDTVPGESERPAMWTGLRVGSAVSHAAGNIPITINRVVGPFKKLNDTTFRLDMQKETLYNARNYVFTFIANHPGDAEYKPATQQGEMIAPARNTTGVEQHIRFLPIANQKTGGQIVLTALSDAGLPVRFYVKEGPVMIKDSKLFITTIPPRAKFPMKVTVVAWQYGKSAEPAVQTAIPVEQTFYIMK